MANLNGQWKLSKVENFEAYLDALGLAPDFKTKALTLLTPENNITQEITVSGSTITIKSTTPLGSHEHTSALGATFADKSYDGKDMQNVLSLEGETLVEKQSGAINSTNTRQIVGGNLVYTLTSNGVSSVRTYTSA